MTAQTGVYTNKKSKPVRRADSRSFEELVVLLPTEVFVAAVGKAGLPAPEARLLCQAFKELKG